MRTASSSRSATGTTRRTSPSTARVWNVEPAKLPHLDPADPRDADLPSRRDRVDPVPVDHRAPTRPCRCPSSRRIRRILAKEDLFVVVSDAFLTETAAARRRRAAGRASGARRPAAPPTPTGPCTSPSKAIDPPGRGAVRPGHPPRLRPADGLPRQGRRAARQVERRRRAHSTRWRECSRGRPCDYSGMSYDKLRGPGAIQWPCNDTYPEGRERQYEDGVFNTVGRLLRDVRPRPRDRRGRSRPRSTRPGIRRAGRSSRAPNTGPPPEEPDEDYPVPADHRPGDLPLPHAHQDRPGARAQRRRARPRSSRSRTRTPRGAGDQRRRRGRGAVSTRARSCVPARLGGIEPGVVFMPFHYGDDGDRRRSRRRPTG